MVLSMRAAMQGQTSHLVQSHSRDTQEVRRHLGQPGRGDQLPDGGAVAVQVEHLEEAQLVGGVLGERVQRFVDAGHRGSVNTGAQDGDLRKMTITRRQGRDQVQRSFWRFCHTPVPFQDVTLQHHQGRHPLSYVKGALTRCRYASSSCSLAAAQISWAYPSMASSGTSWRTTVCPGGHVTQHVMTRYSPLHLPTRHQLLLQ